MVRRDGGKDLALYDSIRIPALLDTAFKIPYLFGIFSATINS